jgi:hypothetical protein
MWRAWVHTVPVERWQARAKPRFTRRSLGPRGSRALRSHASPPCAVQVYIDFLDLRTQSTMTVRGTLSAEGLASFTAPAFPSAGNYAITMRCRCVSLPYSRRRRGAGARVFDLFSASQAEHARLPPRLRRVCGQRAAPRPAARVCPPYWWMA